MMKAVATALVLIAGAAVVLWYGNTLNSWILGGLIGGLAALLVSIPISLTLFSYLSRRRDDQLRAEAALAGTARYEEGYEQIPTRRTRGTYAVEEYVEDEEEFWNEDERYYQEPQRPPVRNLPLPSPQRQPTQSPTSNRLPAPPRAPSAPLSAAGTRSLPATRGKDAASRRPPTRQINYPGLPGYESGAVLRQQRSAALRAARMEKIQQDDDDDVEVLPTYVPRRASPQRSERDLTGSYEQLPRPRPSQQLPPSPQKRQRVVESRPSRHNTPSRALPSRAESTAQQNPAWENPDTETLDENYYPQTEPIRRSTGPVGRNPRLDRQVPQTENPSGSLRKPLVRRAPYTYEDDPIRQELSQQLRPPKVRRSSRLDSQRENQD